MRILHLPGRAVFGYSSGEIEDILNYFKPDITVTTSMKDIQRRKVEKNSFYESIHLDTVMDFTQRKMGDEVLFLLNNAESLDKIDFTDYRGMRVTLITDQIKEEMNPKSFYFELVNTSIIDRLLERLNDFNVLTTNIEAGKKPEYNGNRIYGFGLSNGLGGPKIPNVITGKRPHIETLNASKVGLLAVPGLGDRFSTELQSKGIKSRRDLSSLHPNEILEHDGIGPYRSTKWVCSAKAIEEEDIYRINKNDLEEKHRLFIDIETDSLNPSIIWHIGVYDDSNEEYHSFLVKDPDKKGRIIEEFMDYLEENVREDSVLLAWYGKKFDFEHLDDFIDRYDPDRKHVWDSIEKIDFMYWTDKHAALPCRSSKLYDVSSRLGYESDLLGLDGEDVARMYTNYMEDREKEPDWKELKTYAKDDVVSMKYIYDRVKKAPVLHDINDVKREYRKK